MIRLSLFFFSQIGATDNPGPTYHAAGVAHAARTFLTANMLTERKLIANEGCIEHDRSSSIIADLAACVKGSTCHVLSWSACVPCPIGRLVTGEKKQPERSNDVAYLFFSCCFT